MNGSTQVTLRWHRAHELVTLAAFLSLIAAQWFGLINARPAANLVGVEQVAQRIFYTHMGTVMAAVTGLALSFVCSLGWLLRKRSGWDLMAAAGVEVGLVASLCLLATGSIWAKPTWNTWWTWDPRLTSMLVLVLVYVAYLILRNGLENPRTRATFAAVYALLAYAMVPLTYYSAVWFRSIHPMIFLDDNPTGEGDFGPFLGPTMTLALQWSMLAFVLLALCLVFLRWRMLRLDRTIQILQARLA